MLNKIVGAILILLITINSSFGQIILDESYDDWGFVQYNYIDEDGIGSPDILNTKVFSDSKYLYFKIELDNELLLQDNSGIVLYLDIDNSSSTGLSFNGIGADLVWNFGNRRGFYYSNGGQDIWHDDIGLISAPTVSSAVFEIAIERKNAIDAIITDDIQFYFVSNKGEWDYVPDRFMSESINLNSDIMPTTSPFELENRQQGDFRVLSYNVQRDRIFNNTLSTEYSNLLKSIDPDVYCFQEVYDFSDKDLLNKLSSINVIHDPNNWYTHKQQPDIITISRYPILHTQISDGNSIVVLDIEGSQVCIANCHLPCCDNNSERVDEIDNLLSNIRSLKEGNIAFTLESEAPIIFLGDMNLVGDSQQLESLINGDIIQNSIYGEDVVLDWDGSGFTDLKPKTTGAPFSFTWINPSGSFSPGRLDFMIFSDHVLKAENAFALNTKYIQQDILDQFNLNSNTTGRCSDHLPLVADFILGSTLFTEINEIKNIKLYPNPANQILNIESEIQIDEIICYNSLGSVEWRIKPKLRKCIKELSLSPGYYVAKIYTGGKSIFKPFIIVN